MGHKMIPDEIPAPVLAGVSAYELGNGEYALALVDADGDVHAFRTNRTGLTQIFAYVGSVLDPDAVPHWQ